LGVGIFCFLKLGSWVVLRVWFGVWILGWRERGLRFEGEVMVVGRVKAWRDDVYTCHESCVCVCVFWSIGPTVENKCSLSLILEGLLHDMMCCI